MPWDTLAEHRWVLGANAALGYLAFILLAAVPIFVSVLVETDSGRAAWITGWALTAFTVPLAASAFIGGRWAGRIALAVSVAATAVGLMLLRTWDPTVASMLPALIVCGFGLGWLFAPLAEAPLRTAADDRAGAVSATIILMRLLGMAAGSSILTAFVLAGIADIDVSGDVSAAVLAVFHQVPWIALPAVLFLLPALRVPVDR